MKEETKEKINEQLEEKICTILDEGIQPSNIEMLDMLIDIHKDVANEEYWKGKENMMRYGNYDRRYRDDYGRDEYGARRRDSRARYMGHEHIERMADDYGRYMESRDMANRGNYGAKDDALKSLEYMLESMVDFVEMLKHDATSQEEMNLIREYTQQIASM